MKPNSKMRCESAAGIGTKVHRDAGWTVTAGSTDVSPFVATAVSGVRHKQRATPRLPELATERGARANPERNPDALAPKVAHLLEAACRRTGLRDYGSPPPVAPLSALMKSLDEEANVHRLGRFLAHVHVRDLLEIRLQLVNAWTQLDNLEAEPLRQPIFVTGMPRSGSTFLHELLSLDVSNRAPRVWEVMYPLRTSNGLWNHEAARIWRAETNLWWFRRLAPQADTVYPMRARTPHECVAIHSYTFLSQEFVSSFHIPGYESFLETADLAPAYHWEKRFLQYLQCGQPARRWVLKSPDHVRSLEALWQVFPDAYVIQTHRHPLETLVSSSHLTEVLRGMFSRSQTRQQIGRRESQVMADNMGRVMRFRDEHPEFADRFIDVHYQDLITKPVATLQTLYDRMGLRLSNATADSIQRLASNRGRYGLHRNGHPPLSELGLDPQVEAQRFGEYCSRFGIKPTAV